MCKRPEGPVYDRRLRSGEFRVMCGWKEMAKFHWPNPVQWLKSKIYTMFRRIFKEVCGESSSDESYNLGGFWIFSFK